MEESILLDLKGVLLEAKQHIPPVLERLHHPNDEMSEELRRALDEDAEKDGLARGCAFWYDLLFFFFFFFVFILTSPPDSFLFPFTFVDNCSLFYYDRLFLFLI